MLAQVSASKTDEEALTLAKSVRNDDDLRQYFTDIIAYNSSNKGAAERLIEQGRYSAAKLLIDEGAALIQSDAYLQENKNTYTFVSGDSGCGRLVRLLTEMHDKDAQGGYLEAATSTVKVCHNLVTTNYAKEIVDSDGVVLSSNLDNVQAVAETAHYLAQLGLSSELAAILKTGEASLAAETDISDANSITLLSQLGRELAQGGELELAQGYYDRALALLLKIEKSADAASLGNATRYFFNTSRNTSNYGVFLSAIDSYQLQKENSITIKSNAVNKISEHFEEVLGLLADASDIIKNEEYPAYADMFLALGMFERAAQLSNDEALGDVEKDSIKANIANAFAKLDAFPVTVIASVDTDGDGMPNFFAPFATEQMIADSGLVLDVDSDNDGTNDEDDAYPLDASRQ